MNRPTLIYRCPDAFGLGATFVMIAAYAAYCARHGLALALDMRAFQYAAGDRHAGFFAAFEIAAGVPLVTDLGVIEALSRAPGVAVIGRANRLPPDEPPPAPILDVAGIVNRRLAPWFGVAPPPGFAVRLAGALRDTVTARLGARSWAGVTGVHFRHGNGEFLQTREDFLTAPDYRARVAAFEDSLIARLAHAHGAVFVAGDNREFVARMVREVPRAFTLGTPIPDVPYMEYLREAGPERALAEAATDLWALASCEEVVCVRSSFAEAVAIVNPAVRLDVIEVFKLDKSSAHDRAVRIARLYLLADPSNADAWTRLAEAFESAGRMPEAAGCAAGAALAARGAVPAGRLRALLLDAARIDEAVTELATSLAPGAYEAHAARNMARLLLSGGLPDLAQTLLRAAVASNPDDPRLHALLAAVLDALERPAEAVAPARRAVELAPENAAYRLSLVKALHRAGDPAARQTLAGLASVLKKPPADS